MDMVEGKAHFLCVVAAAVPAPPLTLCFLADSSAAECTDVFGLNGQVEHKLAFIRTRVPRGTSLVLVGHSIGCYIILEMMKRSPELKVCEEAGKCWISLRTAAMFQRQMNFLVRHGG